MIVLCAPSLEKEAWLSSNKRFYIKNQNERLEIICGVNRRIVVSYFETVFVAIYLQPRQTRES